MRPVGSVLQCFCITFFFVRVIKSTVKRKYFAMLVVNTNLSHRIVRQNTSVSQHRTLVAASEPPYTIRFRILPHCVYVLVYLFLIFIKHASSWHTNRDRISSTHHIYLVVKHGLRTGLLPYFVYHQKGKYVKILAYITSDNVLYTPINSTS